MHAPTLGSRHTPGRRLLTLLMLLLGLSLAAAVDATDQAERAKTLVIGKVSDNPRKHYRRLKPMVDYAVARLPGIEHGRVLMAKDNAQMIELLRQGKVDWVTETLFSAVRFVDEADARIVLLKRKKGVREYESVFITRADSNIQRLEDLAGKILAVEDPGSTTAFFLPRVLLQRAGLSGREVDSLDAEVGPGEVGLAFARGEINIAVWVHEGLAAAGAYSDLDWRTPDHTPPSIRDRLRIFHRSRAVPRAVELFRAGLPRQRANRLREILLRAHETTEGRRALYAYQRTERFDPVDADLQASVRKVRKMLEALGETD